MFRKEIGSVTNNNKMTVNELVAYAEKHGRINAYNYMLLIGPDGFDMDNELYEDLLKVLQLEDED